MKKKIFAIAMAVLMVFAFTACGGEATARDEGGSTATASASNKVKKDVYSGEKAITLKSTATNKKVSILFGGNVPKAIDYIVFIILIAATATLIILPIYLKKKKTEKLIAEYKAQNQAKKNKTASKKSK